MKMTDILEPDGYEQCDFTYVLEIQTVLAGPPTGSESWVAVPLALGT
jgi:hypothetical protein